MVMFDLPWDLVEEILSRVPARSLGRLRITCKRVNALCNDSDFIKKHLDKAAKENLVLMLTNFRVYSLSLNLNEIHNNIAFDPSIEFTSKFSRRHVSEQVDITQVFHCNGLLLCYTKEEIKTKLMVVNPCTGQTKWIEQRSHVYYDRYVLGYENNNNKSYERYKILRFPYDCKKIEIFELKSNSWRVLANIPPNEDLGTYGRGVSLKGNAYWISCLSDILSFDFTTERFKRLRLPFQKPRFYSIALSVVREEQLSLLHWIFNTKQMEIWVTNKIDDNETVFSWSKSFTLGLHDQLDHPLLSPISFLIEEEKKVVVSYGRNMENNKNRIYIVGKHGCRKFDYDTDKSNCPPFLFSYVPSLVSLYPPL